MGITQHQGFLEMPFSSAYICRYMQVSAKAYGILITLFGAFLFSAKAVLGKLVYLEAEIAVSTLLLLRMLFALPFYLVIFVWQFRKYVSKKRNQHSGVITSSPPWMLMVTAMLLGMLGYYISSYLDFWGLKYISAGLERVILFSYPALVVILGAILYSTGVKKQQWLALCISYAGLIIAFAGDIGNSTGNTSDIWKGSLLILICAFTFALFVLWSGKMVPRLGVGFFTSIAMLGATIAIIIHYLLSGSGVEQLSGFSSKVYGYMFLMGVFTTVVPSFLVSAGIQKIGSSNVAIVSSIGPVFTIFLAWHFLGEAWGFIQFAGSIMVIAGVLIISRK